MPYSQLPAALNPRGELVAQTFESRRAESVFTVKSAEVGVYEKLVLMYL
ncbi:MAG: hypothetical protein NVSMB6_18820 [Burkholderiaceae bacterium]